MFAVQPDIGIAVDPFEVQLDAVFRGVLRGCTSDELASKYKELEHFPEGGRNTCVLSYDNGRLYIRDIGSRENENEIAAGLFDALRFFDEVKADFIYAEAFSEGGLGQAIMNRLMKAAGYHIVKVD